MSAAHHCDGCRYDPRKHASWSGGATPYGHIADTFAALDSTTKRLRISDALTNMFHAVMVLSPADLEVAVFLTVGKIAPDFEGVELQVGGSTVSSAVADVTGAGPCLLRAPRSRVWNLKHLTV